MSETREAGSRTTTPAIVADDLSLYYPALELHNRGVAVNGVSFEVQPGEILAVVGATGAGKSTLAQAVAGVAGLLRAGSAQFKGGSLEVLGTPVRDIGTKARDRLALRIGYLPQDAGTELSPHLTVGENVADPIFARDRRFDADEAGIAVATLIDAVRLPLSTMNRFPWELSKGQRQRVAIARSLVLQPELLVADDPTAGIDVTARGSILELIHELHAELGFTALVVTADLSEVRRISNRVLVLNRGVVAGHGDLDEVIASSYDPFVRGLADALAVVDALA